METVISVKNLFREYNSTKGFIKKEKVKKEALKGISFEVNKGEIFGLLGPNGAGKTTTIKILTTLLAPTSGEATVLGYKTFGEEKQLRQHINFIFGGERNLYWRISGRDNLTYFADLYKLDRRKQDKRIAELLELVGLSKHADEKVETYSKGMKQRLQIARGLINDPEVIFLDEPTIGLDPIGARELRAIISELSKQGKTILITTHYMHEADELSDRLAVINNGEIVALDTPKKIKRLTDGLTVIEIRALEIKQEIIDNLEGLEGVEAISVRYDDQIEIIELHCSEPYEINKKVMQILQTEKILSITTRELTLEDAYVKLVGDKS